MNRALFRENLLRAARLLRAAVKWLDRPMLPALIAIVAASIVVEGELQKRQGDWSAFIVGGSWFVDPGPISMIPGPGYDGQFFYKLALDPWTPEQGEFGTWLDTAHYRHQRILYPLLVWAASLGGRPSLVPEMMVIVNIIGIGLIGFAGGLVARTWGLHASWGVLPAMYPGFLLTLVRCTAEIVAAACLAGAVAALSSWIRHPDRRWRAVAATLLICLALLARETVLLFVVAAAMVWGYELARRVPRSVPWHLVVVPPVVLLMWHVVIALRWGHWPISGGSGNIGPPFEGLTSFVQRVSGSTDRYDLLFLAELRYMLVIALLTVAVLVSTRAPMVIRAGWSLYVALAIFFTGMIWVDDWSYLRALMEAHLLAAVILLGSNLWVRLAGVALYGGFWYLVYVEIAHFR
jgi:hypothetical protein